MSAILAAASPVDTHAIDRRGPLVTAAVVAVHALAFWTLGQQSPPPARDLIQDAEIVMTPAPAAAPEPVAAPPSPQPPMRTPVRPQPSPAPTPVPAPTPTPKPVPAPQAEATTAPVDAPSATSPSRATGAAGPANAQAAPDDAPATARSGTGQAAAPAVVLPSADADYLDNPSPSYPRLSKRLGEQGTVIVRVLISVDGRAELAELRRSSGFERLDQAALETVRRWRYVPGRVNGQPAALWFQVPIHFVLE